jgi:hypothetical protein
MQHLRVQGWSVRVRPVDISEEFDEDDDHPNLEVAINESLGVERVGDWFLRDPDAKWAKIAENQIVRIPAITWFLARLLKLGAWTPSYLLSLVAVEDGEIRISFAVSDAGGECLARLAFTQGVTGKPPRRVVSAAAKDAGQWRGNAKSYLVGQEIVKGFEGLLANDPLDLIPFELKLRGGPTLRWDGREFLGQHIIECPAVFRRMKEDRQSKPAAVARIFRIREEPAGQKPRDASRSLRYTDAWPSPPLWDDYPNWEHAYGEEGRSGQDESTLKPSRTQNHVHENAGYTAGDATLPSGVTVPALIHLRNGDPAGVTCFGPETIWTLHRELEEVQVDLTPEQLARFPLLVCSRLSRSRRKRSDTIRFVVDDHGRFRDIAAIDK